MSSRLETKHDELVDRLHGFEPLAEIPRQELAWLCDHGVVTHYAAGDTLMEEQGVIDFLWILLKGRIAIDVDRGAGPRRAYEWKAGDVSGLLPYSRMKRNPGLAYVLEEAEALRVSRHDFSEMIQECPEFVAHTVHLMLDRARTFNTNDLHDEKLMSLGRLSAGLAHELNNPASATVSAARALETEIVRADQSARALGAVGLSESQIREIERVREVCLTNPLDPNASLAERMEREERIQKWLESRGADTDHAAPLGDTSVTIETLDLLAEAVHGPQLEAALRWIATGCTTRALAQDIERAAHRIHDLVSAVKRFTYMDRSTGPELVDIGEGLRDTVEVIRSKAQAKSAEVELRIEADLPAVKGAGGELNQIWLNLIDNALDAIAESGRVELHACTELDRVLVRIVDNGPGVPTELLSRIFDPFFTTKEPGHGTGLGLDIALNIARRHGGEIQVDSRPGRTEFTVRLPEA